MDDLKQKLQDNWRIGERMFSARVEEHFHAQVPYPPDRLQQS